MQQSERRMQMQFRIYSKTGKQIQQVNKNHKLSQAKGQAINKHHHKGKILEYK